jgi:hypothetical protein
MRHQTWVASRDSDGQKHPESSTGNFGVSTGNLGASTGNPYFHPLFNPSSIPNELNCFTADAARSNGNTKKTFTGWRPEDEDLFRELMEVDHVTYNGQRYAIEGVYKAFREQDHIRWPGLFFQKLHETNGIDDWIEAHWEGMDRWADYNP